MTLKIVTDSTNDLPIEVIQQYGITVVPLFINIGEKGYLDGVEITRQDFYSKLPDYDSHPTTGTPGPEIFTKTFEKLISEGASQILSIHISKNLSATVDMAASAAQNFDQGQVAVRDSEQLSLGTGFQVESAAQMAQKGKNLEEIIQYLDALSARTFVAAKLDTLEYLRRSGRMNAFMTGLGTVLKIKPILTMKNGVPGSERVRTRAKADASLISMLEAHQPIERFALLHTNAPDEAESFRKRVSHLLPEGHSYSVTITPVIGAHVGPDAYGFALVSQSSEPN